MSASLFEKDVVIKYGQILDKATERHMRKLKLRPTVVLRASARSAGGITRDRKNTSVGRRTMNTFIAAEQLGTALDGNGMSNIDQAATWLATTPDERKPHPLVPYLQQAFGWTAGQAIAAIREAHLNGRRRHDRRRHQ